MQNFDEIAATYDLLNHLLSLNWDRYWRQKAVQAMNVTPQAKMLDVCTGTADVAIKIAEKYRTVNVYGVDLAGAMLRVGRTKLAGKKLAHRVALIQADALRLPFADGIFDGVSMAFGLRNLTERAKGIQEMRRVLKANGRLVLLEFAPPPQSWFGKLYHVYLRWGIPVIGQLVSRSVSAYQYLAASIEDFPAPEEIVMLSKVNGFVSVSRQRLMFGVVVLYVACKQDGISKG